MAGTSSTGKVTNEFKEERGQHQWKIRNWDSVAQSKDTIQRQKFVMEVGQSSKWEVGLAISNDPNNFMIYWKLIHAPEHVHKLESTLNVKVHSCVTHDYNIPSKTVKVSESANTNKLFDWPIDYNYERFGYLDDEGALNFEITIKVMMPQTCECFVKIFASQTLNNFAALLMDSSSADLKVVSSDGQEHTAHKSILKAQCPVFAAMFRTQFSESTTGIVNVQDIAGKTMGILLHFFYTGELLPIWCDEDTIVEFTYATGKYQMTQVLQMLDDVLENTDTKETSNFDTQLLNIAYKLSLKKAEKRLVKRVKKMIEKIENTADLLALLGNKADDEDSSHVENLLVRASKDEI